MHFQFCNYKQIDKFADSFNFFLQNFLILFTFSELPSIGFNQNYA